MTAGGSGDDATFVGTDPLEGLATNKFLVKVGVELARDTAGLCTKGVKSFDDGSTRDRRESVEPAVARGNVHEEQGITVASQRDAVAKDRTLVI